MSPIEDAQIEVCRRLGTVYDLPNPEDRVGIALQTAGQWPLNALRHPKESGTCGWYLWWGDTWNDGLDFFKPLHVEHLREHCLEIMAYLALFAGWRVELAPG